MKAKQLLTEFRDAAFIGEVASLRNTYAVFATESHFILVTFSGPLSGNFNLVKRRVVEGFQRRFGGRKNLTSGEILKRSSFTDRFDVLRVLYVLEAMKQATKKWAKPPGRGFVFAVKRSAGS
ncbi:MAG: hypothetical protein DMF58_17830 [Acidobacteria bacterium]|nr:MAG: hypothetical protein DMF58_17830 [Acidobacteriota bacterium]